MTTTTPVFTQPANTNVFTLTRYCECGNTVILGVFDCMEAALERLRVMADCTDPGDEYRIECFNLRDFETELEQTERSLRSRAEYRAKQARIDELESDGSL
jgi:hypothetical protein